MSIKFIRVTRKELNTYRASQIKTIIKKISVNKSIHPQRVPSRLGDDRIVFCVTDNFRITDFNQFNIGSDINERFKTFNPRFNASYYEIWDKEPTKKEIFNLIRIYFHLYLSKEDKEYIMLHTDPKDNDITHGIYKRSPHLHIKNVLDDKEEKAKPSPQTTQ